ncbi:MAG: hypothetical protein JW837_13305 [Sedimentisphaerales bacterium]|nr:hypothetical protein [Sedimentisphaerales bacterium]
MRIAKFKFCLILSTLFVLYGLSYSVNTVSASGDNTTDSNNVQTKGIDSQRTAQDESTNALSTDKEQSLWTTSRMIAFYIAIGLAVGTIVAWLALRKTLRTRLAMKKSMIQDPDIDDFLIIFNWTPKVLYFFTMIASVLASILMFLHQKDVWLFASIRPEIIGGVWFAVFFLNFLVEEYNITIKTLLITILGIGFLLLWLNLVGWVSGFLGLFKHFALSISATGYLLVSLIGFFTILISWLKGLFYYVTITPNYMNLQEGPTETGEQIGREDYNTRVDTSNFFGRLLGFGNIIITFKDKKRQPITFLVDGIKSKSQMLEKVRAKLVIDHSVKGIVKPPSEPGQPPES